jgi:hypothetical protein
MSLEQYKDANRKELWEILQIQVEHIKKLEAYLQKVQADRINDIAKERKRWGREDLAALAIRDLEQQAKGAVDVTNSVMKKLVIPKLSPTKHEYFKAGIRALAYGIDKEANALKAI